MDGARGYYAQWINDQIKIEIKQYKEINDNNNTKTQLQWDTVKAVLRRKYISDKARWRKASMK